MTLDHDGGASCTLREWSGPGFLAEEGLRPVQPQQGKVLFSMLEETAVEVGDAVTQEVLREELAACDPPGRCCPECGHAGLHKTERPRVIQTRRGPVEVREEERFCPACRRAFFPLIQSVGAGRGL
jgi:hypothetical protein